MDFQDSAVLPSDLVQDVRALPGPVFNDVDDGNNACFLPSWTFDIDQQDDVLFTDFMNIDDDGYGARDSASANPHVSQDSCEHQPTYDQNRRKPRKPRHSIQQIRKLQSWVMDHLEDPYLSAADRNALADQTGLSSKQVLDYIANFRRRKLPRSDQIQIEDRASKHTTGITSKDTGLVRPRMTQWVSAKATMGTRSSWQRSASPRSPIVSYTGHDDDSDTLVCINRLSGFQEFTGSLLDWYLLNMDPSEFVSESEGDLCLVGGEPPDSRHSIDPTISGQETVGVAGSKPTISKVQANISSGQTNVSDHLSGPPKKTSIGTCGPTAIFCWEGLNLSPDSPHLDEFSDPMKISSDPPSLKDVGDSVRLGRSLENSEIDLSEVRSLRSHGSGTSGGSAFSRGSYVSLSSRRGRRAYYTPDLTTMNQAEESDDAYQCPYHHCSKVFKTSYTLERHMATIHEPKNAWLCNKFWWESCPFCDQSSYTCAVHRWTQCMQRPEIDRTFYRKDLMKQHLTGFHKGPPEIVTHDLLSKLQVDCGDVTTFETAERGNPPHQPEQIPDPLEQTKGMAVDSEKVACKYRHMAYICPYSLCKKKFVGESGLHIHECSEHPSEAEFHCTEVNCQSTASTLSLIRLHEMTWHGRGNPSGYRQERTL